jgi:hypothetical protein
MLETILLPICSSSNTIVSAFIDIKYFMCKCQSWKVDQDWGKKV